MARARQTLERRQLGLTLRRIREETGSSQHAAAEAIGRVRSRIVELEDGKGTLSQEDLSKLLDYYNVTGEERETVLALGAETRKRQRRRTYTDLLPGAFQRFADLEASAVEINCCESGIIPGLLQSPGYVRAVIEECDGAWWEASDSELEQRIAFRLDRQAKMLGSDAGKSLRFVLNEDALRAVVGSPTVMDEQLRHLLRLMDEHSGLEVRVLSHATPRNPVRGGGFTVFGFAEKGEPVGFSTRVFGPSTYCFDPADISAMSQAFAQLRDLALSPRESRRLADRILEGG